MLQFIVYNIGGDLFFFLVFAITGKSMTKSKYFTFCTFALNEKLMLEFKID